MAISFVIFRFYKLENTAIKLNDIFFLLLIGGGGGGGGWQSSGGWSSGGGGGGGGGWQSGEILLLLFFLTDESENWQALNSAEMHWKWLISPIFYTFNVF